MEENFSFQIKDTIFRGNLNYQDTQNIEVLCSSSISESSILKAYYDNATAFDFNGTVDDKIQITAVNCYVTSHKINIVDKLFKFKFKIKIETLYFNKKNINEKLEIIHCALKFSCTMPFNENDTYIAKYNCDIFFNESVSLRFKHPISLKKLNSIIFDLKILLQVLILNKNVEIIKKLFYTIEMKEIEQIQSYNPRDIEDKSKTEYLLDFHKNNDLTVLLDRWFDSKEKYGKIFDYLSGILKESSLSYLEFKYFALAQWVEAYSRELLNNKAEFRKNLKSIFRSLNLKDLLNFKNKDAVNTLINDIVCYRNHLVHINKEDNLDNTQMQNLYEILKSLIYICITKELSIKIDEKLNDDMRRKYQDYLTLKNKLGKCEEKKYD